jgi:uncharacterized protein (DUF1697 family)
MPRFVALLRGINVGGNKKVPMADLKKAMEKAGYDNVKTLLASGNVVFEADEKKPETVRKDLEALLEKTFKFPIPTLIRTAADIQALITADPFKGIRVTDATRLYVTFLTDKPKAALKLPYVSEDKAIRILRASPTEVISVMTVSEDRSSVDAMAIIETTWGRNVTPATGTRWKRSPRS